MIRLLAAFMSLVAGSGLVLISRWERPGRRAELRAELHAPRLIEVGFWVGYVAPIYPTLVMVTPAWTYQGATNWSLPFDPVLQGVGLGLWIVGVAVSLWASWVLRHYLAMDGLAVDHQLVTQGPYGCVRHPFYGSFTAVVVGTTLVFRSYLLLGLSVVWLVSILWWVTAEERLLASDEGLGDAYRAYADRTGRFLPKLRHAPRDSSRA